MTTALHVARARRRRARWIALVVTVVVLAVAGGLLWRWYDDPAQRADRISSGIGRLDAVEDVTEQDGVLVVELHPEADADEIEDVYDEAARWATTRGSTYAAVHVGAAVVPVGPGYEHVDPELPTTIAGWDAPEGVEVEVTRDGGSTILAATAERTPSVTTMAWLLGQDLGAFQSALVGEASATDELSRTSSRVRAVPGASVDAAEAVFTGLADLADLDPAVDVDPAGTGTLSVETDADQVDAVRQRVTAALDRFPLQQLQVEVVAR